MRCPLLLEKHEHTLCNDPLEEFFPNFKYPEQSLFTRSLEGYSVLGRVLWLVFSN